MSKNQNAFMAKIDAFGNVLQRSKIVSFLMILMVFAAGVFLLWKMPNESDLPQLHEGEPVPEDIVARLQFKSKDMKDVARIDFECRQNYILILRIDPNRTKKILDGYKTMMEEVRRRGAAEKEEDYEPLNTTDEAIAGFVKALRGDLFSYLLELGQDKARNQAAEHLIEVVVGKGIIMEPVRSAEKEDAESGERPPQENSVKLVKILDVQDGIERLTDEPVPDDRLLTPETAARETAAGLWKLFPEIQHVQQAAAEAAAENAEPEEEGPAMTPEEMQGKLKDFFSTLYKPGNLSFDQKLTEKSIEDEIRRKTAALPDILHKKGEILVSESKEKLSPPDYQLYIIYRQLYDAHRLVKRTWGSLLHKICLVAALIVLSWFFILNFHPELVGNNRSIGLIVFIVIFSMLFNCGIMWLFNRLILDGRLANRIPLYLAMPFALPALMIASLYSGRSAVFAGLFVAGVSAVALDLSFPAFATGLFVCAVGTASVRHVYDYPKFFIRAFVACSLTMLFSAIVFYQNPDVLSFLWRLVQSVCHWQKPDLDISINQLGSCFVVPLVNGIVTAGIAVVLIMLMVSALDVTCSMSYLSMIDRNHPLLKKLQMEAPGTYHHCERVALLAEEAANSVGAMSLKAQAYALYHDVGKLASPEMFTENASGKDMFKDKLPAESAAIIRNHVEYGVQLAKKYNLKTPLRRAIECHHGDDFISFFYEKEKERTGTIPPEEPFRYPGPRPEELETVILMLADCCEAAVCSMDEPTEDNVRALVEKIFNGKLQRGQLDAADVTMAQLAKIRESFLKTFKSMNHTRISYARHQAEEKQS